MLLKCFNTVIGKRPRKTQMATPTQHPFCDLPDEIHLMLARKNWVDLNSISRTLWEDMQPALHFTTHMLEIGATLLWFTQLLFGKPAQSSTLESTYWSRTANSWNLAAVNDVKRYFEYEAAGQIKFKLLPRTDDTKREVIFGETMERSTKLYKLLRHICHDDKTFIDTSYHAAFEARCFESGTRSCQQDVLTRFLLGVTVIHELAHAVYISRRETCNLICDQCTLGDCHRESLFYNPRNLRT
jgi:hypothetical protein